VGIPRRKKTKCESRSGWIDSFCQTAQEILILLLHASAGYVEVWVAEGPFRGLSTGPNENRVIKVLNAVIAEAELGTVASLGVRRQQRLAGMSRWLDGIFVRIESQVYHYRPRTEPEAAGPRRVVTSAFADFCSSGGSPGNSLFLR